MRRMDTGKRLRFAMERKGMTIKELSEKAHISVPTLKRYINGLHSPSHFPAGKMAIVLAVSAEWLRGLYVPIENVQCDDDIYSEGNKI